VSVDSKLALLIFGLFALGSFFIVLIGLHLHLNVGVELSFLITVFSGILVGLFATATVIWRTLKDSLSKKLEHLHKFILGSLLGNFKTSLLYMEYSLQKIKMTTEHLERHGSYLGIALYPNGLLEKIQEFIFLQKRFQTVQQKIIELSGITAGDAAQLTILCYRLGYEGADGLGEPEDVISKADELKKKHPELAAEGRALNDDLWRIKNEIIGQIEAFFRRNDLTVKFGWQSLYLPKRGV